MRDFFMVKKDWSGGQCPCFTTPPSVDSLYSDDSDDLDSYETYWGGLGELSKFDILRLSATQMYRWGKTKHTCDLMTLGVIFWCGDRCNG